MVASMRRLWCFLVLWPLLLVSPPAAADNGLTLTPPVSGRVIKSFDGGSSPYSKGHRGVDLAADAGAEIRAAAPGTVYFNGVVAGRPSVSIDHGSGLRTTYTPVVGTKEVGAAVAGGDVIGHLSGPRHCGSEFCLHWGLTDGTAYFDPMLYVTSPPIRLLPMGSHPKPIQYLPQATVPLPPGGAPVPGRVTSPFGMRVHPVTGVYKLHDGVDFGAPCGTTIRLPWPGRVVSARNDGAYGFRVIVDHGGTRTAYAHMPGLEVSVGQELPAGARVGQVGSTGYSTGCHLHWMAWRAGKLIDPLTLLK